MGQAIQRATGMPCGRRARRPTEVLAVAHEPDREVAGAAPRELHAVGLAPPRASSNRPAGSSSTTRAPGDRELLQQRRLGRTRAGTTGFAGARRSRPSARPHLRPRREGRVGKTPFTAAAFSSAPPTKPAGRAGASSTAAAPRRASGRAREAAGSMTKAAGATGSTSSWRSRQTTTGAWPRSPRPSRRSTRSRTRLRSSG